MAEKDGDDFDNITKLDIFLPVIVKCVDGAELVPYLSDILNQDMQSMVNGEICADADFGEIKKIRQLSRSKSRDEATLHLLELIKNGTEDGTAHGTDHGTDKKRRWKSFINALEQAEYPFVSKVLQGDTGYEICHENQTRIIECLAPYIIEILKPKEIFPDLVKKGIINNRDVAEILAEESNHGSYDGALILLDKIPRRTEDWYELFLEVLFEFEGGRYKHLAQKIDSDFVEKKENQIRALNEATINAPEVSSLTGQIRTNPPLGVEAVEVVQTTMEYSLYNNKGDNFLSAPRPAFISDSGLNASPSEDKIDDLTSTSKKMKLDTNEDTIPKQYSTHEENSVPEIDDNTSCSIDNVSDKAGDASCKFENLNDLSKQTNDIAYQINNSENETNQQRKKEKFMMDNMEDIIKNIYTLGLDPDSSSEPKITEKEENLEAFLDEIESIEDNEIARENFELRGYQKELARPGIGGFNTIVIAPTGSGKTHVAMEIIKNHLDNKKSRMDAKVVLIVNNSTLACQHLSEVKKYLDFSVKCITGYSKDKVKSFEVFVNRHDIFIVTAQIWLNSLLLKDSTINTFTLVIFDECHHCTQKHPYNKIMEFYMDVKQADNAGEIRLPQIIGLTASVHIGKTKDIEAAKEKIMKLMSNLDVREVSTVRSDEGKQELFYYAPVAVEEKRTVPERKNNLMGQLIEAQMEIFENQMKFSECVKPFDIQEACLRVDILILAYSRYRNLKDPPFNLFIQLSKEPKEDRKKNLYDKYIEDKRSQEKIRKIPGERGGERYTQWIGEISADISVIKDSNAHQFYITSRKYLDILNRSLIIYRDARASDAFEYICKSVKMKPKPEQQHKLDSIMIKWVQAMQPQFKSFVTDQTLENPKLKELENIVLDVFNTNMDMRAIVFVKTKDLGTAIVDWMNDSDGLKHLNPATFFGAQASFEQGGLTKNEQTSVLTEFRDGKKKLIVATTIAEEGLDIAKCNLVVRYEHVTNVIGMVQSRGRARATDSKYAILGEQKTTERHEMNVIAEIIMQKAILKLEDEIQNGRTEFERHLMKLQIESKISRDAEKLLRQRRKEDEGVYHLQCGECSKFLCLSVDIRKIMMTHHAVICPEILEYVQIERCPVPGYQDYNIRCRVGKLICKKCGNNVGNISIYKSIPWPVLTAKSIRFQDVTGKYKKVPKQWKDAPFTVEEIDPEDLSKLIQTYRQLYKK